MTTIAAAKKGKKICIGSDSLSTFGSRKEQANQLCSLGKKIIKCGSMHIGYSGSAVWGDVIFDYFSSLKPKFGFGSIESIYEEMVCFHQALKDDFFLTPQQNTSDLFESSEFMLLLINKKGIFEIDWSRNVREYAQFAAIGTGDEYAMGAMKAVYESERDVQQIVKIGLEAASNFDRKTAAPFHFYCI